MLRKIRLAAALLFFTMITLLFLDFTGIVHGWFGWMAKIQFLPAVLALNVGVVIALVLLTLLLGRVYCSVICPLGVFQDIISWVSGKVKKNRFRYSPALSWLRYGVLAVFVVALVAGAVSLAALIAPYSAYGRIVSNLLTPLYQWGEQCTCPMGGACGQLCFLFGRCLDERSFYFCSCSGYCDCAFYFGMAWRKNLLQYHLPGGYSIGILI